VSQAAVPGRGLVTRRAVADLVRRAAVGCYGVTSVSGPRPWDTLVAFVGRGAPGVRVHLGPPLRAELYLSVAHGVPVAEVARNVDEAVRYAVRQALGRDLDELVVHVERLRMATAPRGADGAVAGAGVAPAEEPAAGPDAGGETGTP
jgi:uncharacterized alkaline shock family protein YloU